MKLLHLEQLPVSLDSKKMLLPKCRLKKREKVCLAETFGWEVSLKNKGTTATHHISQ